MIFKNPASFVSVDTSKQPSLPLYITNMENPWNNKALDGTIICGTAGENCLDTKNVPKSVDRGHYNMLDRIKSTGVHYWMPPVNGWYYIKKSVIDKCSDILTYTRPIDGGTKCVKPGGSGSGSDAECNTNQYLLQLAKVKGTADNPCRYFKTRPIPTPDKGCNKIFPFKGTHPNDIYCYTTQKDANITNQAPTTQYCTIDGDYNNIMQDISSATQGVCKMWSIKDNPNAILKEGSGMNVPSNDNTPSWIGFDACRTRSWIMFYRRKYKCKYIIFFYYRQCMANAGM